MPSRFAGCLRPSMAVLLGCVVCGGPLNAAVLKINGSTTVNAPVAEAAEILRAERGMHIHVDTQSGSSGGISMLADNLVQIGMSSKPPGEADRAKHPGIRFKEIHIGEDAVALIVSKDVWLGGVRALSRRQMRGIYEGRITNWSELGGPDKRIAFFNKEPGRGTWEVFADWLYGDAKKAPPVSFPEVGGNEETRTKVANTRGALSQLSSSWADDERVFALGIRLDDGRVVQPTPKNIATGAYPMSRPLFLLTNGEPAGEAKRFVDFMLGERGQALVRKHGYLSLDQLKH
ncbi:MAG: phosphate ABC transporter substrate-binding protein [Opitutaceae bacterium]